VNEDCGKRQDVRQWGEWTVRKCAVANYSDILRSIGRYGTSESGVKGKGVYKEGEEDST
jgi:hypothetical protein